MWLNNQRSEMFFFRALYLMKSILGLLRLSEDFLGYLPLVTLGYFGLTLGNPWPPEKTQEKRGGGG